LCTVHRAENTDDPQRLSGIFKALEIISAEISVVLPLHPWPRSKLLGIGYDFASGKNLQMNCGKRSVVDLKIVCMGMEMPERRL